MQMTDARTTGILLCDRSGTITHWDAGAEKIFGYRAAEALGQSLDLIVPEEFRGTHWGGFNRVVESGTMNLDRAALNVPARLGDGRIQPIPIRFVFLQGPFEDMVGVAALCTSPRGDEEAFSEVTQG